MHIHSQPCSGGGDEIEKHIDELLRKGFAGMVITNHFYRGDTRIDRALPWGEFVAEYEKDFERARTYAKDKDFDVLFGIEEHIQEGNEVLVYGITPAFLRDRPQLKTVGVAEYAALVHEVGGLLYQAHPYRDRFYISHPYPFEEIALLDGVESYNAANQSEWNDKAEEFAVANGMAMIAGSDGHSYATGGRAGILSPIRIRDNETLVGVLKAGNYQLYKGE